MHHSEEKVANDSPEGTQTCRLRGGRGRGRRGEDGVEGGMGDVGVVQEGVVLEQRLAGLLSRWSGVRVGELEYQTAGTKSATARRASTQTYFCEIQTKCEDGSSCSAQRMSRAMRVAYSVSLEGTAGISDLHARGTYECRLTSPAH